MTVWGYICECETTSRANFIFPDWREDLKILLNSRLIQLTFLDCCAFGRLSSGGQRAGMVVQLRVSINKSSGFLIFLIHGFQTILDGCNGCRCSTCVSSRRCARARMRCISVHGPCVDFFQTARLPGMPGMPPGLPGGMPPPIGSCAFQYLVRESSLGIPIFRILG